jgi:hypothetical protein
MPARHFTPSRVYATLSSLVFSTFTRVVQALSGAITLTVTQLLGGFLLLDANGAARNVTTPTAAAIIAAVEGADIGTGFDFVIRNTAGGAYALTLVAGAGVTLSGTATVGQNNSKWFRCVFDNVTPGSEACTIYSIGTFVH